VKDADSAAAVAAAPAVRHGVLRLMSSCQVSRPADNGNSHTAAASALNVYAEVAAAPVSCASTAARAWKADG
jgi:hypothetical protein